MPGDQPAPAGRPGSAADPRFSLLVGLLIVSVAGLAGVALWQTHREAVHQAERSTATLARVLAEQTARTVQAVDLTLTALRDALLATPDLPQDDTRFREAMSARLAELPYVRSLFIIAPSGFIAHDTDYPATPRVSLADRAYFAFHKANPDLALHISDPLVSRSVGAWFVSMSRRITRPDGSFGGIVVAAVEPRYFERFYGSIDVGAGGIVSLLTRTGIVVSRHPKLEKDAVGTSVAASEPFLSLLAGRSEGSYRARTPIDGIARIISYRSLDTAPLVVLTGFSEEFAFAQWRLQAGAIIAAAAALEGLIIALTVLVRRRWHRLMRDIAEQHRLQRERQKVQQLLLHQARHDVLTGLANRTLLLEELARHLAAAETGGAPLALLYIGLDGFKAINDTLGPAAGDALLQRVAERLSGRADATVLVARVGGDEFAVLQTGSMEANAAAPLAANLVEAIGREFEIQGNTVRVGASIGVARAPDDGLDADRLLQAASIAMYRAKDEGRGTWCFFAPAMQERLEERQQLRLDLGAAVAREQLSLVYQPIVRLASGAVDGFEALLRWSHPVRGPVPPGEFIAAAEEGGLMVPIGAWALHEACREAVNWPDHVRVAVNLSPVQFRAPDLLQTVARVLDDTGLPASQLNLEITEAVFLLDSEANLATMHALRKLGIQLVLDDFGTGYASLSYLQRFPFDKLKIDQSFVRDLQEREDSQAIVRSVLGLAAALDMETTAEGVETSQQRDWLRTVGCAQAQGYLFGRAMPPNLIRPFLAQRGELTRAADHTD